MNTQDSKYKTLAPYLILAYEAGPLSADVSVRQDRNSASGFYRQTLPDFGGITAGAQYDLTTSRKIDYDFNKTSFSLGGNYRITNDVAVFARYSDGAAYNADRITFFNNAGLVNGTQPDDPAEQGQAVGRRRQVAPGRLERLRHAVPRQDRRSQRRSDEHADLRSTTTSSSPKGLELEAAYRVATSASAAAPPSPTPNRPTAARPQAPSQVGLSAHARVQLRQPGAGGRASSAPRSRKDRRPGQRRRLDSAITLPAFATRQRLRELPVHRRASRCNWRPTTCSTRSATPRATTAAAPRARSTAAPSRPR